MTSVCDSMSWLHPICMETQKKIPNLLQSAVGGDKGPEKGSVIYLLPTAAVYYLLLNMIAFQIFL